MDSINLNNFITLVLINNVEAFRDSYSLTKVLSWKFDIISAVAITKILEEEKLINKKTERGISKYETTQRGKEYIAVNMVKGKTLMLQKYNGEKDFIKSLFNR